MKKIFAVLIVAVLIVSQLSFNISAAQKDNFIHDKNSTFETGIHTWTTLAGGNLLTVNNPDGNGKVLKFYNIPSDKTYATCMLDIREYIQLNVTNATKIYGSMKIYSENPITGGILRIRTSTANGFSLCTKQGVAYCTVGTFETSAKEWTTINFSFDVALSDLSSTENWNLCFDGIARSTDTIYVDNVYISTVELTEDDFDDESQQINFISENYSTFENGTHNWSTFSGGRLDVVDNPNGEGKVLKYYDIPDKSYASCMLDIREYIQSNVERARTIYVSFKIYSETDLNNITTRIRTLTANGLSLCSIQGQAYCSIGSISALQKEWTKVTLSFDIALSDLSSTEPWRLCFDGLINKTNAIYIDDVYIGISMPIIDDVVNEPIPEKTEVSRFDQTLVGTIRWDAFTESTPNGTNPSSQVARVLSPKKYHGQAPYFSIVNDDDTIAFSEYTVETWESEAKYAVDAGLDYFAYLWYETTSDMSQPRKFHLESDKKDIIKMACILQSLSSKRTMTELFEAMKDSCYLTLDGRPVVFLYNLGNWTAETIYELRQAAANAGIEKALYVVGMSTSTNTYSFATYVNKDVDAISWYSTGATSTGQTYQSLADVCENTTEKIAGLCSTYNLDLIPSFTAGRDSRARIQTGVSWGSGDPNAENDSDKPYANRYALQPTMNELQTHIENILTYTSTSSAAKTNIVLSYAWNEHDEGGWLCPTLKVDENNDVIKNSDGSNAVNTERLEALSNAIDNVFGPEFIYGDLNNDSLINKKDDLLLQMYLANLSVTIDMQAADVYYDGLVNKKDLLMLKKYLANWDVVLGKI